MLPRKPSLTADRLLRLGRSLLREVVRSLNSVEAFAVAPHMRRMAKAYFVRASEYALRRMTAAAYAEVVNAAVAEMPEQPTATDLSLAYISTAMALLIMSYRVPPHSGKPAMACIPEALEAIEQRRQVKC